MTNEIGVSPSISPKFPVASVPYGSLLPRAPYGMTVGGRHISCDANSYGFMREIPQCWLTGHAAGVGAALAADQNIEPLNVDVAEIRKILRQQGAYLSDEESFTSSAPLAEQSRSYLTRHGEGSSFVSAKLVLLDPASLRPTARRPIAPSSHALTSRARGSPTQNITLACTSTLALGISSNANSSFRRGKAAHHTHRQRG